MDGLGRKTDSRSNRLVTRSTPGPQREVERLSGCENAKARKSEAVGCVKRTSPNRGALHAPYGCPQATGRNACPPSVNGPKTGLEIGPANPLEYGNVRTPPGTFRATIRGFRVRHRNLNPEPLRKLPCSIPPIRPTIRIDPKKADVPYSPQLPEPKWDYEKARHANGGSFATNHPNDLSDFDEDESSQVYVVEAVQIAADPSSQTAA
jgi:hypothetical protein